MPEELSAFISGDAKGISFQEGAGPEVGAVPMQDGRSRDVPELASMSLCFVGSVLPGCVV